MINLVKNGARITVNGTYGGVENKTETVTLKGNGLSVDLTNIENVVGSAGNDSATLNGILNKNFGVINLGKGDDTLTLGQAHTYDLKLTGVEHVTGVAGATLNLRGAATFDTDGSVNISSSARDSGKQLITFTDLKNDITVDLGGGKDKVIFGIDVAFNKDVDGNLQAVSGGHRITFDHTANSKALFQTSLGNVLTYQQALANVDTSAPAAAVVTLYSGDANATVNDAEHTAGFTISGTNESGAIVALAGQTVVADTATAWHVVLDAATITGYGQGAEGLTFVSTDAAGNTTDTIVNLTVDTVVPVAAAVTGYSGDANATVNDAEHTAGFTISGTNESGAIVALAGQTVVADTATAWHVVLDAATITGYGQGAEGLTFVSTDAAGNTTDTIVNLTVDTVAPVAAVVTLYSGDANATVNDAEHTAGFTISGTNESGAIVALAGQTVVADTATAWHVVLDAATITGYGQGAEGLTFVSTDAAGNTTDTIVNLTVDTVAPTFTVSAVDTSGSPDYFIVTFNEAVNDFTFSDLSTNNSDSFGTAQVYNEPVDISGGSMTTFMVRFDPLDEAIMTGDMITLIGAVTDAAGNNAVGAFAFVG